MLLRKLGRANIKVDAAVATFDTLAGVELKGAQCAVINFFKQLGQILTVELALEAMSVFDCRGNQ